VDCPEHGPTVVAVPWARHKAGHTRAFDDTVAWLAVATAKSTLCQLLRIAWRTVGAIVAWVAADATAARDPLDGLRRIGIDEISYKRVPFSGGLFVRQGCDLQVCVALTCAPQLERPCEMSSSWHDLPGRPYPAWWVAGSLTTLSRYVASSEVRWPSSATQPEPACFTVGHVAHSRQKV
jgi:hypothetical protein